MCRFIALAVKEKHSAKNILAGYYVSDNLNKSLVKSVPEGYGWLWITDGHCCFDFFRPPHDLEAEIEKIRKKYTKPKYRKQGWSARRIKDKILGIRKRKISRPGGLSERLYKVLKEYVKSGDEMITFDDKEAG